MNVKEFLANEMDRWVNYGMDAVISFHVPKRQLIMK